ncbi:MAG: nucleotidyltransferase family protein [Gammaproteobacteria bacterium]|nr:nucleotidyltransferase family protein [Gammaproteobacteria bacterium]MBT8135274.1 nucleotidyltransferase family protein [Gammaproteobacteria bacterium]NNJ49410.1 nucleotidyltransferase family protein [Gammaproteobacteria bacterium]
MTGVTGILLAAGSARRFGAPKLLHPLHNGLPVAAVAAKTVSQVLANTLAVVKPGDHALIEVFTELGLDIIENPRADEGMGTSLAAGVTASVSNMADGWLIALADMPWIQPATISALLERLESGASIVAPVHAGRRGHPVGFSSHWFGSLAELRGDKGARDLIAENAEAVDLLTTADAGVLRDVDYPDDLYR